PGTPAAAMPDQVPEAVKAERNTRLLEVAGRVGAERSRRLVGRVMEVLVDGAARKDAGQASGRTRCNRVVNFDRAGRDLTGAVVAVRITEALPHSLRGELAPFGLTPLAPMASLA
ncbi:MAG TPA: TRAM domain-containing protein, partial [Methylomirabilota bacterium]|nr:TRAM domain-containing protein [Methylomirabilota bacterium]